MKMCNRCGDFAMWMWKCNCSDALKYSCDVHQIEELQSNIKDHFTLMQRLEFKSDYELASAIRGIYATT